MRRMRLSWIALAAGLLGTAGWFSLLRLVETSGVASRGGTFFLSLFLDRGAIPALLTAGWLTGLVLLLGHIPQLRAERNELAELESGNESEAGPGDAPSIGFLSTFEAPPRGEGFEAHLDRELELERRKRQRDLAPVRYLIGVIPMLGFMGTVLGIARSVAGFATVVGGADEFAALRPQLVAICGDLGMAFGTTLLALVYSAALMGVAAWIEREEDALLDGIESYCARAGRLGAGDEDSAGIDARREANGRAPAIILHTVGGRETDLIETAEEAIAQAVVRLGSAGGAAATALGEITAAGRLARLIETQTATTLELRRWLARREAGGARLAEAVEATERGQEMTRRLLAQLGRALIRLEREGIPCRLTVRAEPEPERRTGAAGAT